MSRLATALAAMALAASLAARAGTLEVAVVDAAGRPVADAAVYAVPATGASPEARGRTAQIEQVDREFIPFVSVIQVGTSVAFPNRDPILHHVYSFSAAKNFEIKLYSGKAPQEIAFDRPGVVVLGCNIHDWMVAYVAVVPTPWFARSESAGTVRLRDLPAGQYDVHAWHPLQRASLPPQALGVAATGNTEATFRFDLQTRKAKFKPPLDRLKY